jgi:tRNA (cytidine/uridine-2'-O-)-methyltransferase
MIDNCFHLVLFEPEIPPNTGNIIRLCANAPAHLHLIHPLGFSMETHALRRAGLDYHDLAHVSQYKNFDHFISEFLSKSIKRRVFAMSTKAQTGLNEHQYQFGDVFLFGPESRGLPEHIRTHEQVYQQIKLPMKPSSRSLNLSNAAAITLYWAWGQEQFRC